MGGAQPPSQVVVLKRQGHVALRLVGLVVIVIIFWFGRNSTGMSWEVLELKDSLLHLSLGFGQKAALKSPEPVFKWASP